MGKKKYSAAVGLSSTLPAPFKWDIIELVISKECIVWKLVNLLGAMQHVIGQV